jgi:hypothetical protein
MPDFTPLFVASRGRPIEVGGQCLHATFRLELAPNSRLHVLFERAVSRPVQGLSISAVRKHHRLAVANTTARHLVLWEDTAPKHVEISVPPARLQVPIWMRNVWRDEKYGTMMYGLNAAAMVVTEKAPRQWLLQCSDGWGTEPNFSDLVVSLIVEPPSGAA